MMDVQSETIPSIDAASLEEHWKDGNLDALLSTKPLANMENNSFGAFSSASAENSFMDSFTKFVSADPGSSSSDSEDGANFRLLKGNKNEAPPPSSTCSSAPQLPPVPRTQETSSESSLSSDSDYEDVLRKRTKKKTKGSHHKKIRKLNGLKKLGKQMDSGFGFSSENGEPSPYNATEDQPERKKKLGRPPLSDAARKRQSLPQSPHMKVPAADEAARKEPVFLQNGPCFEVGIKLSRCRECRMTQRNKKMLNIFCRFYHFRKLKITKNGINSGGFAEPGDCTEEDLRLWMPAVDTPPEDIDIPTAKFLLTHVGDQFCDLVTQEKEAKSLDMGPPNIVAWKRVVSGVREMCDVCETTIFNAHWVCRRCGFVVCIDCYKTRKAGIVREEEELRDRDEFQWLLCTNKQVHDQAKLMLTEIVAGSALEMINQMLHEVRNKWSIPASCKCPLNTTRPLVDPRGKSTTLCKQLYSSMKKTFPKFRPQILPASKKTTGTASGEQPSLEPRSNLSWMSEALNTKLKEPCSLLDLKAGLKESEDRAEAERKFQQRTIMYREIARQLQNGEDTPVFHNRFPNSDGPLSVRVSTLTESELLYPDVPHAWLCDGKLLLLKDPLHPKNMLLFQEQWKRGQPVLVGDVSGQLDMSLWHPDGFVRDFGEVTNDLVNCRTGAIIPDIPMKKFWEGFENFSKRLMDENGEHMLLKLKDWPPGEDFSELLPDRFQDLLRALPLASYTHRDGALNLAARLPPCFVRPDLGPKMYNAYGSALYPTKGTTNLHLDISDAVNVMVYVGLPQDGQEDINEALKAIDEGGCDSVTRRRVREKGVRPGALWHIFNAKDADKIRQLLNKVAVEKGEKLEAHHDPIHDQSWYLEENLRRRLYREYGVKGYAIAQCLGDAVFIPAGAPHQVRNLHSCVKVAEDFVSPENIGHCFTLTQEFRDLSDTHTNHEDKLQIKNIIYHTVRDALAHLLAEDKRRAAATAAEEELPATPPLSYVDRCNATMEQAKNQDDNKGPHPSKTSTKQNKQAPRYDYSRIKTSCSQSSPETNSSLHPAGTSDSTLKTSHLFVEETNGSLVGSSRPSLKASSQPKASNSNPQNVDAKILSQPAETKDEDHQPMETSPSPLIADVKRAFSVVETANFQTKSCQSYQIAGNKPASPIVVTIRHQPMLKTSQSDQIVDVKPTSLIVETSCHQLILKTSQIDDAEANFMPVETRHLQLPVKASHTFHDADAQNSHSQVETRPQLTLQNAEGSLPIETQQPPLKKSRTCQIADPKPANPPVETSFHQTLLKSSHNHQMADDKMCHQQSQIQQICDIKPAATPAKTSSHQLSSEESHDHQNTGAKVDNISIQKQRLRPPAKLNQTAVRKDGTIPIETHQHHRASELAIESSKLDLTPNADPHSQTADATDGTSPVGTNQLAGINNSPAPSPSKPLTSSQTLAEGPSTVEASTRPSTQSENGNSSSPQSPSLDVAGDNTETPTANPVPSSSEDRASEDKKPPAISYPFVTKVLISDIIEGKNPYKANYYLNLKPQSQSKTRASFISLLESDCTESQLLLRKAFECKLPLDDIIRNIGTSERIKLWTKSLDKKDCLKLLKFFQELSNHPLLKNGFTTLRARFSNARKHLISRLDFYK